MDLHSLTVSAGWIAVSIGLIATFAQFRRVATLGVEGVSLATWVLFVYMGIFWITYGLVARSWEVIVGSLVVLPLQLAILFRLKPWAHWAVLTRALAYFIACCVLPTVLWGWAGGVFGAGVAMTINRAPQIIELVRHPDATGVSAGSWYLGVVGCLFWISYYVGAHLWAALTATAFAGMANLVIAVLTTWRHTQSRRMLIAQEVFAT
jgi:uncharacterized protein with PQ loop repeat